MIRIGLITTEAELQQVFRLRYDAYVEELGATMEHADHQAKALYDEWDITADIIGAWHNDELVGCLRINYSSNTNLAEYEPFIHPLAKKTGVVAVTSKLVVAKAYRGTLVSARLCQAGFTQLQARGVHLNYLTCRSSLVEMYSRLGFRMCGAGVFHPEAGWVLPMVLLVQDYEYLQQIKSPLAAICAKFPINQPQARMLRTICTKAAVARRG